MRKIKDVLRLKLHAGLSHERVAASLNISKGVVAKYTSLAAAAGLDWPTVERLSEAALERRLVGAEPTAPATTPNRTSAAFTRNCAAKA